MRWVIATRQKHAEADAPDGSLLESPLQLPADAQQSAEGVHFMQSIGRTVLQDHRKGCIERFNFCAICCFMRSVTGTHELLSICAA
jgi:hypothetical protein